MGHRYLHLLARGVTAAVDAGDGNRIDPSIAVARPLGSKEHMVIIQDNPVWRCIAISFAIHRLIAGHTERAGARWRGTVIGNIVADSHVHHPVVWWPENGWICCCVSDRRRSLVEDDGRDVRRVEAGPIVAPDREHLAFPASDAEVVADVTGSDVAGNRRRCELYVPHPQVRPDGTSVRGVCNIRRCQSVCRVIASIVENDAGLTRQGIAAYPGEPLGIRRRIGIDADRRAPSRPMIGGPDQIDVRISRVHAGHPHVGPYDVDRAVAGTATRVDRHRGEGGSPDGRIRKRCVPDPPDVRDNPCFARPSGSAIHRAVEPDRILVGGEGVVDRPGGVDLAVRADLKVDSLVVAPCGNPIRDVDPGGPGRSTVEGTRKHDVFVVDTAGDEFGPSRINLADEGAGRDVVHGEVILVQEVEEAGRAGGNGDVSPGGPGVGGVGHALSGVVGYVPDVELAGPIDGRRGIAAVAYAARAFVLACPGEPPIKGPADLGAEDRVDLRPVPIGCVVRAEQRAVVERMDRYGVLRQGPVGCRRDPDVGGVRRRVLEGHDAGEPGASCGALDLAVLSDVPDGPGFFAEPFRC